MNGQSTHPEGDRAISATVTHILALGITAILISGLLLSANVVLEDQRENSAREQLRTVGNRLADEFSRAAVLAQDGGNVSVRTRHPARIAGRSYDVTLLTGGDCDTRIFDADACLALEMQSGATRVMVPIRNETDVTFEEVGAGTFTVTALANDSAPPSPVPAIDRDLRVGVGDDIGSYAGGSTLNLANRDPIAGFTFSPGRPTVDSVVHFQEDTKDLDGVIAKYEWELGDGGTVSGEKEFNHSYANPGKYTVTMNVTDDDGESDNVSKVVSVGGLIYNGINSVSGNNVEFEIENKYDSPVEIREILIDPHNDTIEEMHSDGEPEVEFETVSEGTDGGHDGDFDIYDGGRIVDVADDSDGMGAPVIPDEEDAEVDFRGFEGPTDDTDMNAEMVFVAMRYEVDGQSYTAQFTLSGTGSNPDPPEPGFTYDCSSAPTCTFDASSWDELDIIEYRWTFGDGNTTAGDSATAMAPSNSYPSNGTYDVTLTMEDEENVTSSLTKTIDVGGSSVTQGGTRRPVVFAVNAGGDAYETGGITYTKDTVEDNHPYLTGGDDEDYPAPGEPIDNTTTAEEPLYQDMRTGDFGYDVPVANGEYEVTFRFAEINAAVGGGDREFDVELEGSTVIDDLDVHGEVGHDYALLKSRIVEVDDGTLDVDFDSPAHHGRVSAVVVRMIEPDAFQESGGEVVMEAENYMTKTPGNHQNGMGGDMSGDEWHEDTPSPWYHIDPASGGESLEAGLDNYDNALDTENGERLDYFVNFSSPGEYHVWVRMYCPDGGDDSIHVGLNGTPTTYGGTGLTNTETGDCAGGFFSEWEWISHAAGSRASVNVDSAGVHTVNIWMREDGVFVDKIVLRKDENDDPSDMGPGESDIE